MSISTKNKDTLQNVLSRTGTYDRPERQFILQFTLSCLEHIVRNAVIPMGICFAIGDMRIIWKFSTPELAAEGVTYIEKRSVEGITNQEYSFFVGYYAHLITDSEYQRHTRDPQRVRIAWERILRDPKLKDCAEKKSASWNAIKELISKQARLKDIHTIEAEYLENHLASGYLTEVIGLRRFPDYLDFLPEGAVVRKIAIMGYLPKKEQGEYPFVAIIREEYATFVNNAVAKVVEGISNHM